MDFNDYVGLVDVGFRDGAYVMELDIGEQHLNRYGYVHGGALFALLDTTMSRVYFNAFPPEDHNGVTLQMNINYLKSAKHGRLTAFGYLVKATRRTAYVEGRIDNAAGDLIARATATMYFIKPD